MKTNMETLYKNKINKLFNQLYKADKAKSPLEKLQILLSDHDCKGEKCKECYELGNHD